MVCCLLVNQVVCHQRRKCRQLLATVGFALAAPQKFHSLEASAAECYLMSTNQTIAVFVLPCAMLSGGALSLPEVSTATGYRA
jgi:hypothetical protein